ncbi:MAG: exodeoxyribonuclease V subunit gamma [Aromatoleum sp.]|uniref:exodeoxyribonuclease V subunit gamma n=1 Tax=Aromatoleum sp. TaxID=2307007 RepID=UPI002894F8AF|nr:exodeoxyribonuclease V subunit gamma [Aromatoleum sp.]MDT3672370.1 exodeoxyribonuclease V subunit gamma [Aromatoleum sp.]
MLSLAFSNRYEVLLETLLARLADEQPGPFGQREIVVPSAALRRSVELAVAGREGVAANLRFSYLAQWLWSQIGKLIAVDETSPFAPTQLAWRIFGLLGERGEHDDGGWTAGHPRLARYLAGADASMRFDLATRAARVLDHYLTYRPRWLAEWSAGRRVAGLADDVRADEAWQAELWRRLTAELGARSEHPAATFFRAIEDAGVALPGALPQLPASVHVFCLPAMPPLYRDVLRALAAWVEVRLYVLNPCREYWFEIVEPRRLAWLVGRQQDLYFETGNRLLAAWGRQMQSHVDLLFEGDGAAEVDDSLFVPAAGESLLARLQNAVLDLVDPEPGSVALADDDRSVEVHVCHSPTRELEVLQDRLLALFAAPDAPRPDEILVVMPDLEAAAPLIEAVFGTAPPARRIPWTITGLGHTRTNPVARVLDVALALAAGRFPASRVFELLQLAPVAQRFGLDDADLEQVHEWLREAGVRWGLDAAQRGRLGLPALERHSLADGLHRLFLAYALGDGDDGAEDDDGGPGVGGVMFGGRIGAGNPEGGDAQVLGRLARYVDLLQWLEAGASRMHDADGWRALLVELLDRLIPPTAEWADDLRTVRIAVNELHANIAAGGVHSPLPLALVHRALTGVLDDPARGGVPGGAVTFSAMTTLRNLPYRVVCAIGLDDGAFPGVERPVEFDLMAMHPARGDRQRRDDERNLFLDLLLAARERLHLSYAGRSTRDNSEKPPSVLVDELLDYTARATATDPRDPASLAAARRRLTVIHPLQAFSRQYFLADPEQDARLASFNAEYCEALRQRANVAGGALPHSADVDDAAARGADAVLATDEADDCDQPDDAGQLPFFSAPLPAPGAEWREVGLDQLIRFFRNPSRFLLRERLGLTLLDGDEELDDDEPFLPEWRGRQALADRLLPALLGGRPHDDVRALALAGGEFPAGALGERLLEREFGAMAQYAAGLRAALEPAPLPPLQTRFDFALDGERWTLAAAFGDLRPAGLVRHRYDDVRANDYVAGWITHLALCVAAPAGVEPATEWHSRDGRYRLRPVASPDAARAALATLVALYRDGLRRPLAFFPKSAWAWAANGESSYMAVQKWTGGGKPEFGERKDAAIRLAFRGLPDPLDDAFYSNAAAVFGPLIAYIDDPRL